MLSSWHLRQRRIFVSGLTALPTEKGFSSPQQETGMSKTATRLQLPFIGIASGKQATCLREAGAEHVIEDFTDLEGFLDLLSR